MGGARRSRTCAAGAAALALALVSTTSGCFWPAPGQGADRRSHNPWEERIGPSTVAGLEQLWTADVGDGPAGAPVTSAAGVVVGGPRSVHGYDARSGAPRWTHDVDPPLALGQPFVQGDRVLVGRADPTAATGAAHAIATVTLDAASGAVVAEDDRGAVRGVRGTDALLVDGRWFRFGLLQPFWVWLHDLAVVDLDSGEETYRARVDGGGPGETLGLDLTFGAGVAYLWHVGPAPPDAGGPPPGLRAYGFGSSPPSCSFALGRCPDWAMTDGRQAPVLSDDGTTAYSSGPDGPRAIDTATGTTLWTGPLDSAPSAPPALAGGRLFVPTETGDLVVFVADGCGASTCPRLWTASSPAGSALRVQPAVAGGVVITGSDAGTVQAFSSGGCGAEVCAPLWSAATGSAITGAPAVSNGVVYVGAADGRLVAYSFPGSG